MSNLSSTNSDVFVQHPRILVGIDGSASSRNALRWAMHQAELTGGSLTVSTTWNWPPVSSYIPPMTYTGDAQEEARLELTHVITETLGAEPGVPIRQIVAEGSPAAVLIEQAEDADLLVVGSRGHGAFAGMLLGSVSQHCVSHASCPVVVVRSEL